MKNRALQFFGLFIFISLLQFSCSKEEIVNENSLVVNSYQPIEKNIVSILADDAALISDISDIEKGLYIFEFSSEIPEINSGDIVAGTHENGFLLEVISAEIIDNKLHLSTKQTSLKNAFSGKMLGLTLTEENSENKNILKKQKTEKKLFLDGITTAKDGITYDFSNTVIFENDTFLLKIKNGTVTFNPDYVFDLEFQGTNIDFFKIGTGDCNLTTDCEILASVKGNYEFTKTKKLAEEYSTYITYAYGVPIVVIIKTTLNAKININAKSNTVLTAGVNVVNSLNAGIKYQNNQWHNWCNLDNTKSYDPVNLTNEVNLTAKLTFVPEVSFLIYGIAGPYINLDLWTKYNINVLNGTVINPGGGSVNYTNWDSKLTCGVNVEFGSKLSLIDEDIVNYSKSFPFSWTLLETPDRVFIYSGNNQTVKKNTTLPQPLKILVVDSKGNPQPNVYVKFYARSGSVSSIYSVTNSEGIASVYWTSGDVTGEITTLVYVRRADGTEIYEGGFLKFNAIVTN